MFARQTPQRRGAECGWDEPTRPFCPGARSIPHPLHPHTPHPRCRCRRRGPGSAALQPCVPPGPPGMAARAQHGPAPGGRGAAGSAAISRPCPPPPDPPRPRPGGSHGRSRRRCRLAGTRQLIQLCLISKRVLKHGEEGRGLRPRGSGGAGQLRLVTGAPLPRRRRCSPSGQELQGFGRRLCRAVPCRAGSQAGAAGAWVSLRLWRRGAGEPPSGVRPACSRAPAGPPSHPR